MRSADDLPYEPILKEWLEKIVKDIDGAIRGLTLEDSTWFLSAITKHVEQARRQLKIQLVAENAEVFAVLSDCLASIEDEDLSNRIEGGLESIKIVCELEARE